MSLWGFCGVPTFSRPLPRELTAEEKEEALSKFRTILGYVKAYSQDQLLSSEGSVKEFEDKIIQHTRGGQSPRVDIATVGFTHWFEKCVAPNVDKQALHYETFVPALCDTCCDEYSKVDPTQYPSDPDPKNPHLVFMDEDRLTQRQADYILSQLSVCTPSNPGTEAVERALETWAKADRKKEKARQFKQKVIDLCDTLLCGASSDNTGKSG